MENDGLFRKQQRIYRIYLGAKQRCRKDGLPMIDEWTRDYEMFKKWSLENNYNHTRKLFLLKISDGYSKTNCVWADRAGDVKTYSGRKKNKCIKCKINTTARKNSMCKPCYAKSQRKTSFSRQEYARSWTLNKKYGIGLDDFNLLFNQQDGRCLICKKNMKLPREAQGQDMDTVAVDHNHDTNKIRGLLCNACNKGLGHFQDSSAVLRSAINYLITKDGLNEKTSFDSQGFANITNKWR